MVFHKEKDNRSPDQEQCGNQQHDLTVQGQLAHFTLAEDKVM